MRKRIGIEDFLRWAYRDELPKAQADEGPVGPAEYGGAWGGVERCGELGTVIDRENRYGVIPDLYARAEPHTDAVLAAEAVGRLSAAAFDLPEGWYPIADLGPRCPLREAAVGEGIAALTHRDAAGQAVLRPLHTPAHLIRRYAVLGCCPIWEGDMPEEHLTLQANGRPAWFRRTVCQGADGPFTIEVKGTDRHGHPYPDAYQRPYLDPSPVDTVVSRGEYELWRSALDVVHGAIARRLGAYAVEPSDRPVRPWETGDRPKRRVVHSLLRVSPLLDKAPVRPLKRPRRTVSPVRQPLQGAA